MKIAVINGQNHKGSTYHIGKQVADKLGGEVTEFFLPRDFGDFCVGCTQCFLKSETLCPHSVACVDILSAKPNDENNCSIGDDVGDRA